MAVSVSMHLETTDGRLIICTGSLYLLVLVAAKNLRIPIGTSDGHVAEDVGNLMRWPNGKPRHALLNMPY